MEPVDYAIISEALEFYAAKGYRYIDVPWSVRKEAMELTLPPGAALYPYLDEFLVASGEQSFLHMMQDKKIEYGSRLMCVTPCFRREPVHTRYTRPYFMKVELIFVGSVNPDDVDLVISHATDFFQRYLPKPLKVIETEIGMDISYGGIELGSYGVRTHQSTGPWVYGTGVAEPRFSQVLSEVPKGYSLKNIPRGKFGEISKISEEVKELKDAITQDATIMALVELSDLYGAIEGYIKKHFPHVTMEDLKKMSAITGRAFENGHRK